MPDENYTDRYITSILSGTKTIAMVGASANNNRPSYFALGYLLGKGYKVHPVNPGLAGKKIHGQTVYGELKDVPGPVDMVDIFRNSEAALAITRDAITLKDQLGIKVIWMQLSVRNEVAAAEAEAAGLRVVMNRCPKIEYGRLAGEISWVGVYSGVISSRRPRLAPKGVQSLLIAEQK